MNKFRGRHSLVPAPNQAGAFRFERMRDLPSEFSDMSEMSEITQSEDEWDHLQQRITEDFDFAEHAIDGAPSTDKKIILACDNPDEVIDAKSEEILHLKQDMKDAQQRFIWDLSLAVKRLTLAQLSHNTTAAQLLTSHGVRHIVKKADAESPDPKTWLTFINRELYGQKCF